mmetsp:Transcript_37620/g.77291  ORF Transcript_37620/g.77291 Transcript_37620/m.77291 type:complete len:253 (-) Transcript_37620:93-851(-)
MRTAPSPSVPTVESTRKSPTQTPHTALERVRRSGDKGDTSTADSAAAAARAAIELVDALLRNHSKPPPLLVDSEPRVTLSHVTPPHVTSLETSHPSSRAHLVQLSITHRPMLTLVFQMSALAPSSSCSQPAVLIPSNPPSAFIASCFRNNLRSTWCAPNPSTPPKPFVASILAATVAFVSSPLSPSDGRNRACPPIPMVFVIQASPVHARNRSVPKQVKETEPLPHEKLLRCIVLQHTASACLRCIWNSLCS